MDLPPPAYNAPSYLGLDVANGSVPFGSVNTTVPPYAGASREAQAYLQVNRTGSSAGEPAVPRAPRELTEHTFALRRNSGRAWARLKLRSRARTSTLLPAYYEGDPITGSFQLDLSRPDNVQAVVVKITGRLINTRTTGHDIFLRVKHTIWSTSMGDPRTASGNDAEPSHREHTSKLEGVYNWSFSIDLPREIRVNEVDYTLPPTFQDRNVQCTIQYDILVHIKRSRLRADNKLGTPFGLVPWRRPMPPSPLRQISYLDGHPLIGPNEDRDGWTSLNPIEISGIVFKVRPARVTCELWLANPLCYTRGSVIPCYLKIQSNDRHTLDLLSLPKAPNVRLVQTVGYQAGNSGERDMQGINARIAINVTSTATIATTVWWPPESQANLSTNVRWLEGEVHVPHNLTPTCTFPAFVASYSIVLHSFEAAGFTTKNKQPLASIGVEVVTAYPAGPRARQYAPPTYQPSTQPRSYPLEASMPLAL